MAWSRTILIIFVWVFFLILGVRVDRFMMFIFCLFYFLFVKLIEGYSRGRDDFKLS